MFCCRIVHDGAERNGRGSPSEATSLPLCARSLGGGEGPYSLRSYARTANWCPIGASAHD